MRKPKTGSVRIPSPYETTTWKVERSAAAVLMHWMRDIIEKKGLELGLPDVDTSGTDRKSPDLVIYESRRSQNVLCVIEAKPPFYSVFNEEALKEPARLKAMNRRARYFALTNFKTLIWYKTKEAGDPTTREEDQVAHKYELSELENLNDLDQKRFLD